GRIGLYEGETADKLLTGVRAGGGIWSAADLRDYRVIERRPLEVKLANGREPVGTAQDLQHVMGALYRLGLLPRQLFQHLQALRQGHAA
ncbi:gamma-glutamyltransferase, partial [Pseudomonas aeruginosa]